MSIQTLRWASKVERLKLLIDEHESGGETKSKTECPVRIADRKEIGVRWIVDTMNIK